MTVANFYYKNFSETQKQREEHTTMNFHIPNNTQPQALPLICWGLIFSCLLVGGCERCNRKLLKPTPVISLQLSAFLCVPLKDKKLVTQPQYHYHTDKTHTLFDCSLWNFLTVPSQVSFICRNWATFSWSISSILDLGIFSDAGMFYHLPYFPYWCLGPRLEETQVHFFFWQESFMGGGG